MNDIKHEWLLLVVHVPATSNRLQSTGKPSIIDKYVSLIIQTTCSSNIHPLYAFGGVKFTALRPYIKGSGSDLNLPRSNIKMTWICTQGYNGGLVYWHHNIFSLTNPNIIYWAECRPVTTSLDCSNHDSMKGVGTFGRAVAHPDRILHLNHVKWLMRL